MAWPKLRNKSSGPLMTVSNRSGAAHDGARSQGKAPEGAAEGPARLPFLRAQGARVTEGSKGTEGAGGHQGVEEVQGSEAVRSEPVRDAPVRDAPVRDAPVTWPGQAADEAASYQGTSYQGTAAQERAAEERAAEAEETEATGLEPAAAEPESADLPLWDWSPPPERSVRTTPAAEPAVERADPPKPEWKPVVTPVEEADELRPGAGQRRGNLAHLSANPRMRIWQLRVVVAVVILVAFSILVSWQLGL